MTIRPVTSVNLTNSYNQVNFRGRRKNVSDNAGPSRITVPHRLAVPLAATVLAMSPMANASEKSDYYDIKTNNIELPAIQDNNGNVIKSKTFSLLRKSVGGVPYNVNYQINFVNDDNNSNNFERILIRVDETDTPGNGTVYGLDKLSTYKFGIVSEDGSESNNFDIDEITCHAMSEDGAYGNNAFITEKKICDYIKSELNSSRNNSNIEDSIVGRKIKPSSFLNLQNVAAKNKIKNAEPIDCSKYKCIGNQNFKGANGKYKLSYYSVTGADKIELVTVKKDNGPELAVGKNIVAKGIFNSGDSSPVSLDYGITELYDNNMKNYYLSDRALSQALVLIYNNDLTSGGAFTCESRNEEYMCHHGVIYPLTNIEE